MKENQVLARIRAISKQLGCILFRNNLGSAKDQDGRFITYGVCNPGGSDLIGWHVHVIRDCDVGRKVAIFTAIETKSPHGKTTEEQEQFLSVVRAAGGIGGVARSETDASELIRRWRSLGAP